MKYCIHDINFIRLLRLIIKLFKFEIQKCGQILCAHKPCFLMPGHIYKSQCCYFLVFLYMDAISARDKYALILSYSVNLCISTVFTI